MRSTDAVANLVQQLLTSLVQFLLYIIIARNVSVELNGFFVMGMLLANAVGNIVILGLNASNIYYYNKGEMDYRSILSNSIVYWGLTLCLAYPALYFLLLNYSNQAFPGIPFQVLMQGLSLSAFIFLNTLLYSIYHTVKKFAECNYFLLFNAFSQFILVGISILQGQTDVSKYITLMLTAQVITSILMCIRLIMCQRGYERHDKGKLLPVPYLFYGLKSHLGNMVSFLMSRVDVYMVGLLLGPESAGVYMVAILFVERLALVSVSLSTVMFPSIVSLSSNREKQYDLIYKMFSVNLLVTLGLSLALTIIIYPAIDILYGIDYRAAVNVFYILVIGVVMKSCTRILAVIFSSNGKPELNLCLSLVLVILNITFNLLFIPEAEMLGAAMATSLAYFISLILRLMVLKLPLFDLKLARLVPTIENIKILYSVVARMHKRYR